MTFNRARSIHILDRLIPELEANIQLDDLGIYLISEGLITGEEHLMLVKCPSRTEAVIELVQKIKRKGPCSLQCFLAALRRSCNDTVPPHMGHVHLLELFQSNINDGQLSKQPKSKSKLSLLGWTKRGKKAKKDLKSTSEASGADTFQKESRSLQLHPKGGASANTLNLTSDEDSVMFSQSQPTTEMDLTLPSSQDSYLTDPHNEQVGNVKFSLPSTPDPFSSSSNKPSDEPSGIQAETSSNSTVNHSKDNESQVLLTEMKRKVQELEHALKQKNKQMEMYKATVKELMIKYEQVKLKSDSTEHKILDLKDDNRILQYQLAEASKQAKEDETVIDDLEYEVKQLHSVLHRVRMERDCMQRYMGNSLGRRRPSVVYPMYQPASCDATAGRASPPSPEPSHTSSSHNDGAKERPPMSRQHSVDQLRRELSQKDLAIHHKMDQMAQICQDYYYDVPIMRRRWHSDYRLGHMY